MQHIRQNDLTRATGAAPYTPGDYGYDMMTEEPIPEPNPSDTINTFRPTQLSLVGRPNDKRAWKAEEPGHIEDIGNDIAYIPNLNYEPGGAEVWHRIQSLKNTNRMNYPVAYDQKALGVEQHLDELHKKQARIGAEAMGQYAGDAMNPQLDPFAAPVPLLGE